MTGVFPSVDTSYSPSPIQPQVSGSVSANPVYPHPESSSGNTSSVQTSSSYIADVIDRDNPTYQPEEFDDSIVYTYTDNLTTVNGSFSTTSVSEKWKTYTSTAGNSLAVNTTTHFKYGTMSVRVKPVAGSDSGLVFGLTPNGASYWETGVSYYFLFISQAGTIYLGKVNSGWTNVKEVSLGALDVNHTYTIKLVLQNNKFVVYVDDVMAFVIREDNMLTGSGWGLRAGASGVVFSDMSVTSEYLMPDASYVPNIDDSYSYTYNSNYTTLNGGFDVSGTTYTSNATKSLMVNTSVPFRYGTISATIRTTNSTDSGIVFGYSNTGTQTWEGDKLSYYFLFLGQGGVYLGKTNNNAWSVVANKKMFDSIDSTHDYILKLVYEDYKVTAFVDGVKVFEVRDTYILIGTGYGIRTGASGVVFSNVSVSSSYSY